MLNQVVLVGRLVDIQTYYILVKSMRPNKNADGEYESDTIKCYIPSNMYKNIKDRCEIGDIMGVKGRLENKDGNLIVSIEKATFLSSGADDAIDDDNE